MGPVQALTSPFRAETSTITGRSARAAARRVLHKGEHLYRARDRVHALYIVKAGVLKSYRVNEDGEEQVLAFHKTGDICGFDSLANRTAACNVMALDSSSLELIPLHALDDIAGDGLVNGVLGEMSRELQRLAHMLELERRTAEQRVASFLLDHADYERRRGCLGTDFLLPMPRRDLARYLHLATETVSRVFSRLQDDGLLDVRRNHVVLRDAATLRARAENAGASERGARLCA